MNLYKEQYDERKQGVLSFLDQTIAYFQNQGDADLAQSLGKLRENVANDLFGIVLVGEFSAGKSTFLNALMHRRILPSFTSETTATVNFLRHTSNAPNGEPGIVYYRDGHTDVLPALNLSEIEKVVSTRGDSEDQKIATSVDHVDLFLDSGLLQDGVMLVDSPGLNGVADHHREITEQQIKASHASIFMFSADHPGSKTDFEYLRELKSQSKNIFFVLNKINVIRESEGQTVDDVVSELRETYHSQFPDETELPKIWPVAGDAALAARDTNYNDYHDELITTQERRDELERLSRMAAFEDRLWRYLTEGERAHAQLSGPVETGLKALNTQRDYLTAQISLLSEQKSSEDFQKQQELLEDRIQELKQERKDASKELRDRVSEALRNLKEDAGNRSRKISQQIISRAEGLESSEELQEYANRLSAELKSRYTQVSKQLDSDLREELLQVVQDEYAEYFSELEDRFAELSSSTAIHFQGEQLVLSNCTISSNLEQFDSWCEKMQQQIEQREEEVNQLERETIKAQLLQRSIDEQKQELRELKERKQYLRDNFIIPDVVYHSEEVDDSYWRSGLFGWIGNGLFGKKHRTKTVSVPDTSAQDTALNKRKAELEQLDTDMQKAQEELRCINSSEQSPEELEYQVKKAQDKLHKLELEYTQKQKEFAEKLEKNAAKLCSRIRSEIRNYADEMEADFQIEIKRYLDKQNRSYTQAVQDMVNVNLDQELQRTSQKLDDLLQSMKTEGEERQRQLEAAHQALETVRLLLEQGAELSARLESEMNDHVEQEAL